MDNIGFINEFKSVINKEGAKRIFFVSSREYDRFGYRLALEELGCEVYSFTAFEPCPEVSSVTEGVNQLMKFNPDIIAAVGGGSAIDCAKGIKYYLDKDIKILAVPTTAGSGAEVTRTSVLYNNADKQSVKDISLIPEYAVFDYTTLLTLPGFQKISTALDAFCHSFEAFISKNSTEESRGYSLASLRIFADSFDRYVSGDESTFEDMMKCSELAGRAINIAQTAAPHAFSYKLHKLTGLAHGQACAVSLVYIWKYMNEFADEGTKKMLSFLEKECRLTADGLEAKLKSLGVLPEITMTNDEFYETVNGVNIERIANNPMKFNPEDIEKIYSSFIKVE